MNPLLLALVLQPQSLAAQIDSYVSPVASRADFSGVILVKRKGRTVYDKAFGYGNFELKSKHTRDSVFRIASLTKTFTAGAVYALEKQGKLSFNDKLSKYLPQFPKADAITIAFLLSHASGVGAPDMHPLMHRSSTLDEAVAEIAKAPFQFDPGARSSYSNSGYTILAKVIEIVSGKDYESFLRSEFFEPLGMKNTGNYLQSDFVPHRASPYLPGPPPSFVLPVAGYDQTPYLGAGSLWSTAGDLSKWLSAVQADRFFQLDKLSWPLGWGKRTYFEKRANEQTGMTDGYTSAMIFFPSEDLQVVVLSNVQTQFSNTAARDIAGIVLGVKPKARLEPRIVGVESVDKTTVVGRYSLEKDVLEISERKGHLFYRWNDDSDYRYISPIGPRELYVRDEFAFWRWKEPGQFTWSGPFGEMVLKRI